MGGLNLLAFLIAVFYLPEISHRKKTTSSRPSFKKMRTSGMVKGLFSFRLAFSLGRGSFAAFLSILAGIYISLSPALIGVLLTVNMLLTSLLQVYSGNIADRFNRRALVVVGSLISFTYLALIPLGNNFWQLLTICALGGLGGAISMPSASALTVEEGRKFGMGSTIAVFTMAMSISMAIGPIVAGAIADFINISSVFYFSAAMGLIGTSLFIWFTK